MAFIVYVIRILLVALALRYVWRALKRAIQGGQARPRPAPKDRASFTDMRNIEDIEYEDIE